MIHSVSLGCRLNACETGTMAGLAEAAGLRGASILNTCAVTAKAVRESRREARRLAREGQGPVLVTGCAATLDPGAFAAIPHVQVIANDAKLDPATFGLSTPVAPRRDGSRGAIAIQGGCDHACTFCIVPQARGRSISFDPAKIVGEVRNLAALGVPEIVLTGVDIASYGIRDGEGSRLGALARRILAEAPDLPRLRLSTVDPAVVDPDLLRAFAEEPRLMPHLHLSVQSGDDVILKRMRRRHGRAEVIDLTRRLKELRPDIVFGADLIAGFPTESDAAQDASLELVEEAGLTWLHVFTYSAREGTPAARMPQVPMPVRRARAAELRSLGEMSATRYRHRLIGSDCEVVVEKGGRGRTPGYAEIVIAGPAAPGTLRRVTVTGERDGALIGLAA
ncbi:MAG: MiaB/RimO family radical SAM methylthiotransferase [Alphaproteobacteria bacterium]|nr:MiaB/RimO family radical SAM methylthiotransferase [Alphaproteobacteria bacterium]